MSFDEILALLRKRCGESAVALSVFRDNRRYVVKAEQLLSALQSLKRDAGFDMLADMSAADYLHYPGATDRYGVWYILSNTVTGMRLIVKTWLNDPDPELPSVYGLWKGADWMEREVYDMYGIAFEGHPDLRRILMPDEFTGHPLRKDYPLHGRGERHNFQAITRADS